MWWQWLIFALLMIIIPLSIVNLAIWVKKKNNLTNEQEKVMGVNMVKYTLFYWLCDLFYMSFIIESLACKFVFGGLIMLIILYNLSSAIINQTNKRRNGFIKFAIIQDFLVGIGIAIYLIYIISNIALQQIVLAIVAAVFGGLFTLVGVAWTIKKGDADRNAELKRIETERREEERKKYIPYLKITKCKQSLEAVSCSIKQPLNFDDENKVAQIKRNTFYNINIEDFIIKNVSSNNVLLRGIILDDKFYEFDNQNLLEPNNVCLVQITRNWWPSFANLLRQLLIRVDDIIGNKYTIACNLDPELVGNGVMVEAEDGKKFCGYNCKYHIENIALPTLIEE